MFCLYSERLKKVLKRCWRAEGLDKTDGPPPPKKRARHSIIRFYRRGHKCLFSLPPHLPQGIPNWGWLQHICMLNLFLLLCLCVCVCVRACTATEICAPGVSASCRQVGIQSSKSEIVYRPSSELQTMTRLIWSLWRKCQQILYLSFLFDQRCRFYFLDHSWTLPLFFIIIIVLQSSHYLQSILYLMYSG